MSTPDIQVVCDKHVSNVDYIIQSLKYKICKFLIKSDIFMIMVNKLQLIFRYLLFFLAISVYIFWSINLITARIPFFDEVNAWNISANCNFFELLHVCKIEGHFLLWYLLIKPFSEHVICFPYAMYIINWLFAFAAVLVLWLKAPFHPLLKLFITFSLPVQMFTIYARCYSIGMLILFILCSLYHSRKQHPIIYSFLIVLLANTSVIGNVTDFVFGIIYLFELIYDNKKNVIQTKTLIQTTVVFLIGIVLVLIQFANFVMPFHTLDKEYLLYTFQKFFDISDYLPKNFVIIFQMLLCVLGFKFFIDDKKPYLLWIFTTGIIVYIGYNVYVLACWHYMFLFLYFVCAMWVYLSENSLKTVFQKIYYFSFGILCFATIFFYQYPWQWNGYYIPTAQYLKDNYSEYQNARIFLFPPDSSMNGLVPLFKNYNIDFYDSKGNSYKSANMYINQWLPDKIDIYELKKMILSDKNRKNFMIVPVVPEEEWKQINEIFNSILEESQELKFIEYKKLENSVIYELSVNDTELE